MTKANKSTEITVYNSTENYNNNANLNKKESSPEPKVKIRIPNTKRISQIFNAEIAAAKPYDPYELSLNSSVPTLRYCVFCKGDFTNEFEYHSSTKTF